MEYILLIIALFVLLETSFLTYQQLRRNTKRTSTAIYVDTSVLIDGRIVDIAKTGFITAQLTTISGLEHAMGWVWPVSYALWTR